MKTQHDNRELYITIEAPEWHLDIRAAKGQSSATDLSTAAANLGFRLEAKRAREFASAINNAARRVEQFNVRQRETIAAAAREAETTYDDTRRIEEVISDQRRLAETYRHEATADLEALRASGKPGVMSRGGVAYRVLEKKLLDEWKDYAVPSLSLGPKPQIDVPADAADSSALKRDSDGSAARDVLDQIRALGELHATGVLTDDEFATKKRDLLGRL